MFYGKLTTDKIKTSEIMTREIKIRRVEFQNYNRKDKRQIKVVFTDGEIAYISPCCESWEIWHCDFYHKQVLVDFADKHNGYLHGGKL